MKPICLILLFLPLGLLAQKRNKDTSFVYLDQYLQLTNAKQAAYAGVSIKVEGGWMLYAVYPDTTPLVKAYFKDKQLTLKQGPYTVYYPKNIKAREGFYNNNDMSGTWRFWYSNGKLKDSGMVSKNYLSGFWKSWYPNGQLMTEINFKEQLTPAETNALQLLAMDHIPPPYIGIRQGAYKSWYSNGQTESIGQFVDNQMTGAWQWFHQNGARATEEMYKDGIITGLQCFDSTGKPTGDLCSIDKPALLKHFGDYKAFIHENLMWPEEARKKGLEGDVTVSFTVSSSGNLQSFTVNSTQPILKKAVEDLFAQMKEWEPAISHNRTIEFSDEIVIPFRL